MKATFRPARFAPLSRRGPIRLLAGLTCGGSLLSPLSAQFTDFMAMDLEDLSYVRMTTLGRTEHAVIDYPAAATVLTSEDLSRQGVTTLPEALRNVPGMQVGRIDQYDYAISVRGFNDKTVNKLLVMSDGRSLYDGTFSGTNWGLQETLLADLDRIEILRGPGASLWGANAMNGFINIVSKTAQDTLGTHVAMAAGEPRNGYVEARYGWQASAQTAARVYTKLQHQEADADLQPLPGTTAWDTTLVGARIDHLVDPDRRLTWLAEWRHLRSSGYNSEPQLLPPYLKLFPEDRDTDNASFSARWQQPLPLWEGELVAFASFDTLRDKRDTLDEERDTATIDLQIKLEPGTGHELLTGLTYRTSQDELSSVGIFSFTNPRTTVTFLGAFVQDEFDVIPHHLRLTAGAKLERNSYSGWEFQPSLRAIWAPHANHRLWLGVSRAARTPSRAETSVNYYAFVLAADPPSVPLPVAVTINGSSTFSTEHLTSTELGYRFVPSPRLQVEAAVFYNDYSDIRSFATDTIIPATTAPIPHLEASILTTNSIVGHTYGGELNVRWQASSTLQLEASYSYIETELHNLIDPSDDLAEFSIQLYGQSSPAGTARAQISWTPHPQFEIDLGSQRVDAIDDGHIPAYTALHARLAWHPRPGWTVELIGQDLLEDLHREYPGTISRDTTPNLSRRLLLRVTLAR